MALGVSPAARQTRFVTGKLKVRLHGHYATLGIPNKPVLGEG
jgi:hypothetical protein